MVVFSLAKSRCIQLFLLDYCGVVNNQRKFILTFVYLYIKVNNIGTVVCDVFDNNKIIHLFVKTFFINNVCQKLQSKIKYRNRRSSVEMKARVVDKQLIWEFTDCITPHCASRHMTCIKTHITSSVQTCEENAWILLE